MIHEIHSTLPSFKTLRFRQGLNVLLAKKSRGATDRQTRNGAGKTSLVEVIHFLLGANIGSQHALRSPSLAEHELGMRFELAGVRTEVARGTQERSPYFVTAADDARWPVPPRPDKKSGRPALTGKDWRIDLGALAFGLPPREDSKPSFRMLFPYFARRDLDGGFADFRRHGTKQDTGDEQIALTYLLGLDASIPTQLEQTREREAALKKLQQELTRGEFARLVGRAGDLRTELTVLQDRITIQRVELASFRVVPQYQEYETEASRITAELAALSNESQLLRERIEHLRSTIAAERPPYFADIETAYQEVGLTFPDAVKRRFAEVESFHRSIVENRRSHLGAELAQAEHRGMEIEAQRAKLGARYKTLMEILQSGQALEQYTLMQQELARHESRAETLRQKLSTAEQVESRGADLEFVRASLFKRLLADHHEQRDRIATAIRSFETFSRALYEQAGSLTLDPTPRGPQLDVKIQGSRSKGISKMQIFCFDMMLMELCHERGIGPGFLIHDSHLFDGVDSRQTAKALEIGAERAERLGFQYIVTMNQDQVPRDAFRSGFDFDSHILDVRLTDATEDGGLFGLRFE